MGVGTCRVFIRACAPGTRETHVPSHLLEGPSILVVRSYEERSDTNLGPTQSRILLIMFLVYEENSTGLGAI